MSDDVGAITASLRFAESCSTRTGPELASHRRWDYRVHVQVDTQLARQHLQQKIASPTATRTQPDPRIRPAPAGMAARKNRALASDGDGSMHAQSGRTMTRAQLQQKLASPAARLTQLEPRIQRAQACLTALAPNQSGSKRISGWLRAHRLTYPATMYLTITLAFRCSALEF